MILLFSFLFAFVVCQSDSYFVSSKNGDDKNPGTQDKPFKTITRARDEMRKFPTMTKDVNIWLREGEYYESLVFEYFDSGKNGKKIIYQSFNKEKVALTGGLVVDKWEFDQTYQCYKSFVGKGLKSRQVYINGKRAIRARGDSPKGIKKTDYGFFVEGGTVMSKYKNINTIEIVSNNHWRQGRCLIDHITDSGEIHMQTPCWNYGQKTMDEASWIENAVELVKDPFEWYLDSVSGYLYAQFSQKPTNDTLVVLALLERIIYGNGNETNPVTHLSFIGLDIEYATWNGATSASGFPETQANVLADGRSPVGNVEFAYSRNIDINNCKFTHLGGIGLLFAKGSQNCNGKSNVFHDISSHGVKVGDMNPYVHGDMNKATMYVNIYNSSVTNVGVEFNGAPAIIFGYVRNCSLIHCYINEVPYTGISNGWGWAAICSDFAGYNDFSYNLVNNTMEVLFDGGSFYTLGFNFFEKITILGQQNGTKVTNNVFTKNKVLYGSFYFDDGSRYLIAHDNVVFGNMQTALIKGGNHEIYNMWWQNRGKVQTPWGPVDDIEFMRNTQCCPCVGGKYPNPCGPMNMHDNHVIKKITDAPESILKNAGLLP